jgi:hypothetical protein
MLTDSDIQKGPRHLWLGRWRGVFFCAAIFCLLIAMQYRSRAFWADVAADSDEPAHVTTSLMVRDYLVQAFPHSPLAFARDFYAHYAKVAIGHWPPLFYCAEAIWMLLVGRSRVALLLFVALTGAALLGSIFIEVRRRCSTAAALVSIAILMSSDMFYQALLEVRSDLLLGVVVFWAAIYGGEFMHSRSRRTRNLFWLLTFAALLVHGRAVVLLFLPFALLPIYPARSRWKWVMAGILLLLAVQIPHLFRMASSPSLRTMGADAWMFLKSTFVLASWPGMLLALLGIKRVMEDGADRAFWATMSALALAGFGFYVLVPVPWDDRYAIPTLIALSVLAGGGVQVTLDRLSSFRGRLRQVMTGVVTVAAVTSIAVIAYTTPLKRNAGYRVMIADCLLCEHRVSLIAGDAVHEGDLIAESSLSDPARIHTVLRASKVLSSSTWSGYNYRTLYSSPAEVLDYLDRAQVSLVVIQDGPERPHLTQLREAMAQSGGRWVSIHMQKTPVGVTIFRRATAGAP